jgi:hypothetical protein
MRDVFHGMDAKRQQTHTIKLSIPYTVLNTAICGGISGGSQTWRPFSELPGKDDFLTHPQRPWPPPTQNTSALQ